MMLLLLFFAAGALSAQPATGVEFFESRIRPILATSCAPCHTAKNHIAGLDLSTPEGILRGSDGGPVLSKDKPEESKLLHVVTYLERIKMPPTGKLTDPQIAAISEWVKMGAPMPATGAAAPVAAIPAKKKEFTRGQKEFWSFRPVR
ncbi:MAG TPA: c-type cytochrome domain-containing protein, partial [Bryobacteraceae bacterium]|nr:c-type cytochrome domain-containing protein [Bryobacteraceae bacterium]